MTLTSTVAIIEKDPLRTEELRSRMLAILQEEELTLVREGVILVFSDVEEFEKSVIAVDLLLLDVYLPNGEDGVAWLKKWHGTGRVLRAVFVSDHVEEAYRTIECNPVAFVRRSHMDEELPAAVRRYKEQIFTVPERVAVIPEGKQCLYMDPDDIVYFHSRGHYIEIYMYGGDKTVIRCRMEVLERYMGFYGFLRIHSSYLINMKYVEKIVNENKIYLPDGIIIGISDKYKAYAQQNLQKYFSVDKM